MSIKTEKVTKETVKGMSRKELQTLVDMESKSALECIIDEMERTGDCYTLQEMSKMTDGFLSTSSIAGFLHMNSRDCYHGGYPYVVKGFANNSDKYLRGNCSKENRDPRYVQLPEYKGITIGRPMIKEKHYVNVDDENDVMTVRHKIKTYKMVDTK